THGPLANGQLYSYVITASNAYGESAPSGVVIARPATPQAWSQTPLQGTAGNVVALAVNATTLLAGTSGTGVLKSANNGDSWTAANGAVPNPVNLNTIVAFGSTLFLGRDGSASTGYDGVWRSLDNGATWSRKSAGLSEKVVTAIASDGTNFFAGTASGDVN